MKTIASSSFEMSDLRLPRPDRRDAMRIVAGGVFAGCSLSLLGCATSAIDGRPKPPFLGEPIAAAANAADPFKQTWDAEDLNALLASLPAADLHTLAVGLQVASEKSTPPTSLNDAQQLERLIKTRLVSLSSSMFTGVFKDKEMVSYDGIVRWVARKYDVDSTLVDRATTFELEQQIMLKLFAGIWDKLTPEQRKELLNKVDPDGVKIKDRTALVVASGSAAAALLATTALLSGFAFYTTMSAMIAGAAALVGVTLPFAAYTGSSIAVAVLSGPIGWSIISVGGVLSLVWLGSADVKQCAAAVCQINALRARAWEASGRKLPSARM